MAISIRDEQVCSLLEVARRVRKHPNTVRNWTKRESGPQLETDKLGGSVITSWEALARFQVTRSGRKASASSARVMRERKLDHEALRHLQEVHGIGFKT
jgi:hypothetical protein